jgi:hypothetical protein
MSEGLASAASAAAKCRLVSEARYLRGGWLAGWRLIAAASAACLPASLLAPSYWPLWAVCQHR